MGTAPSPRIPTPGEMHGKPRLTQKDSPARGSHDEATTEASHAQGLPKPVTAPPRRSVRSDDGRPRPAPRGRAGRNSGHRGRRPGPPAATERRTDADMHKTLCYKEKGSFRAAELRKSELPVAAINKRSGEGGENGRPEKNVGHPLPHHAPPHPRAQHGRGGDGTAHSDRPQAPRATPGRKDGPTNRPRDQRREAATGRAPPPTRAAPTTGGPTGLTTLKIIKETVDARIRITAAAARARGHESSEARRNARYTATRTAASLGGVLLASDADIMRAAASATRAWGDHPNMTDYLTTLVQHLTADGPTAPAAGLPTPTGLGHAKRTNAALAPDGSGHSDSAQRTAGAAPVARDEAATARGRADAQGGARPPRRRGSPNLDSKANGARGAARRTGRPPHPSTDDDNGRTDRDGHDSWLKGITALAAEGATLAAAAEWHTSGATAGLAAQVATACAKLGAAIAALARRGTRTVATNTPHQHGPDAAAARPTPPARTDSAGHASAMTAEATNTMGTAGPPTAAAAPRISDARPIAETPSPTPPHNATPAATSVNRTYAAAAKGCLGPIAAGAPTRGGRTAQAARDPATRPNDRTPPAVSATGGGQAAVPPASTATERRRLATTRERNVTTLHAEEATVQSMSTKNNSCLLRGLLHEQGAMAATDGQVQELRAAIADTVVTHRNTIVNGKTLEDWVKFTTDQSVDAWATDYLTNHTMSDQIALLAWHLYKAKSVWVWRRRDDGSGYQNEEASRFGGETSAAEAHHVLYDQGRLHYDAFRIRAEGLRRLRHQTTALREGTAAAVKTDAAGKTGAGRPTQRQGTRAGAATDATTWRRTAQAPPPTAEAENDPSDAARPPNTDPTGGLATERTAAGTTTEADTDRAAAVSKLSGATEEAARAAAAAWMRYALSCTADAGNDTATAHATAIAATTAHAEAESRMLALEAAARRHAATDGAETHATGHPGHAPPARATHTDDAATASAAADDAARRRTARATEGAAAGARAEADANRAAAISELSGVTEEAARAADAAMLRYAYSCTPNAGGEAAAARTEAIATATAHAEIESRLLALEASAERHAAAGGTEAHAAGRPSHAPPPQATRADGAAPPDTTADTAARRQTAQATPPTANADADTGDAARPHADADPADAPATQRATAEARAEADAERAAAISELSNATEETARAADAAGIRYALSCTAEANGDETPAHAEAIAAAIAHAEAESRMLALEAAAARHASTDRAEAHVAGRPSNAPPPQATHAGGATSKERADSAATTIQCRVRARRDMRVVAWALLRRAEDQLYPYGAHTGDLAPLRAAAASAG